jgi:two-component system, NtrC family, sensor histidine kinase KinB
MGGLPHFSTSSEGELKHQAAFDMLFQAYLELQESNRQKTAMLAAATHELKTPLAIISGGCELLLSGGLGELTTEQRRIITLSQQNSHRLLGVVNSFLDYSAVEHGRLVLKLEMHDLSAVILEAAEYWRGSAAAKEIEVVCNIAPDLPPVMCDRARIQNVLNALCDNALKFTPRAGRIVLSAVTHFWDRRLAFCRFRQERRRTAEEKDNAVRVSVADTGPGIAAEYQQDIFEEYFQVSNGPSAGMGLGLAIAKKTISAHQGKVWVDSRVGQGSSFSFVLPR